MKEELLKYLLAEEAHAFKGWDFSYLKGRWENEKLPWNYNDFVKKYGDKKIYYITRYGLKNYSEINYSNQDDIWIMFGTESTGIPKKILQTSIETCLRIPMKQDCRSLNLANSVNLIVYEILRQKNFEGLSEFEYQKGKNFILE